ncbi:hypothetical protein [Polaribacter sargassicola]|uniref:hypothetical protein n=1 Tax=Polaribacter sargassicola TaxID=2836891 RepID=UPI001F24B3AE|nr:hypothetical protein [Polaribacter sp. DS7-9]MCG1036804.1 hypothetical protein [Polaribacter sp. DS7-9]
MWFKKLTGFNEISPENVRKNIIIDGKNLISKTNNKSFQFGELEIVSLEELRKKAINFQTNTQIKVSEQVANVQELHCKTENENALFQAASQFNLLEMVEPSVTPEKGIDIYDRDYTQGPACAIACGAGTIYRNYFVPINGNIGQSSKNQVDCLYNIGKQLGNEAHDLWEMKNGYALLSKDGILRINKIISNLSQEEREVLKGKLKVGIQWNTEVTITENKQIVSQIYCSALPVAYSQLEPWYWASFARVILEATYEATLYAAMLNLQKNKSNKVFLTLVGGGVFGNDINWILESLFKAIEKFKNVPLDVKIVSYGKSNALLKEAIENYNC